MYSGTTLTSFSGHLLGAHQKIDRVSRRHLAKIVADDSKFPSAKRILRFEGKDGPDGIKRKSPAVDEPWHYFNPFDETDTEIIELIDTHYKRLVVELKAGNQERAAFEASWLSHAIVDGLTPAHHYPYEEKLSELRGGLSNDTRTTLKTKLVIPGDNRRKQVKNNWKMWGPRGLFMAHGLFEMGVAALIKPLAFKDAVPKGKDLQAAGEIGLNEKFLRTAREIAVLDMYTRYCKKGWTPQLALQVRQKLGPLIIQNVTLAWYLAMVEAGLVEQS